MNVWGWTVGFISDGATAVEFEAMGAISKVVFVGEEVHSAALDMKLTDFSIGVVSEEYAIVDELHIADDVLWTTSHDIEIINTDHYITQGISLGTVSMISSCPSYPSPQLSYLNTNPAPGINVLGETLSGKANLVAVNAGATLHPNCRFSCYN